MKGRIKVKHTWKRLLSLFMSLALLAGLMPAALAAPTTAPIIPGYTQLTELPTDGLDTSKYYLVVTQDSDNNLYALYINQAGTNVGSGALTGANGACTATLTVSGDTVTAAYLNGDAPLDVDDLRITVNNSGTGYTFRSGDYGLALDNNMFGTTPTALTVSVADGLWTVRNVSANRVLGFNRTDDILSDYPEHITDFWGPRTVTNFPLYLYVQNDAVAPVDKGALNAAIAEATALDEVDYTAESWNALRTALTAAQVVAADDSVTQEQVNAACAALEAALDALVETITPPDEGLPMVTVYQQVTGPLENGVYAIYYDGTGSILYHTGTGATDQVNGSVSGDTLALNGGFAASRQRGPSPLWRGATPFRARTAAATWI